MSRIKRTFSPEFKAKLVLEVLKGEKELNVIATENNIQPNWLRNWKREFLSKASIVFDDSREDNLREKLASERKEKDQYAKKVGQLTMQVDWLKKKSEEMLGPDYESKYSPKPFEEWQERDSCQCCSRSAQHKPYKHLLQRAHYLWNGAHL